MSEQFELQQVVEGKEKHYTQNGFLNKLQQSGLKLGFKALHGATTLYCALKSPDLPKQQKLLIVGVLGYFILPTDLLADFLPMVGLADDIAIIMKAISVIYSSITDEMKEEGHQLLEKVFGDKYPDSIQGEF
ncbi:DUF1232 domain-containing protein [Butyricicoccus sp. 1XD8-22]|nr:DUF1232 domain-containing protein [Butyricicoccus sp. 1XD8-22]